MLNRSDIQTAIPIAQQNMVNNKLLTSTNPIVNTLLENSYDGISELTLSTLPIVIPEMTLEDSCEHSHLIEASSTIIAAKVREALSCISTSIKPFLSGIKNTVLDHVYLIINDKDDCKFDYTNFILDSINTNVVNLDDSIFDSPLYPEKIENTLLNYSNVDFSNLCIYKKELANTVYVNNEIAIAFINSNNKELLNYYTGDCSVIERILNEGKWCTSRYIDNIENTPIEYVHELFDSYVFLTKLRSLDEPYERIKGVSLERYNEVIDVIYFNVNTALVKIKERVLKYRQQGLVIFNNDLKLVENGYRGVTKLEGKISYGISQWFFNDLENKSNKSIFELLIGFKYLQLTNDKGFVFSLDHIKEFEDAFDLYVTTLINQMKNTLSRNLPAAIKRELSYLFKSNVLQEKYAMINVSLLNTRLYEFTNRILKYIDSKTETKKDIYDFVENDIFIIEFCKLLNLRLVAKILNYARIQQVGNEEITVEKKREAITRALTMAIVEELVGK